MKYLNVNTHTEEKKIENLIDVIYKYEWNPLEFQFNIVTDWDKIREMVAEKIVGGNLL